MSTHTIYAFPMPTFNILKVLLTAEELAADYRVVMLDAMAAEHREPAHRARHPLGKVPVLEHGDVVLFESLAIARYLDAVHDHRLGSQDVATQARIDQWADFIVNHVGRAVGALYLEEYLKPRFRGQSADADAVANAHKQLGRELPVLNDALEANAFLGSDNYSLADVVALSYCLDSAKLSFGFDNYPALARWFAAASQRQSTRHALAHFKVQGAA